MNKALAEFLDSRNLMIMATVDQDSMPWVTNPYFARKDNVLYYGSMKDTFSESRFITWSKCCFTPC